MAAAYALVPIDALFEESSAARERWDVRLEQQSGTLGQGLISYVGIPIYDGRQLQGYLLVGENAQSQRLLSEAYSQNVVHSFLTISANTTRVCSNLPESDTHYLGTEIPAVVQQAAAESGKLFWLGTGADWRELLFPLPGALRSFRHAGGLYRRWN